VVECDAVCCSVLQYVAACCSVLQGVVVCRSVMKYAVGHSVTGNMTDAYVARLIHILQNTFIRDRTHSQVARLIRDVTHPYVT